ncbi:hypothetical protein GCM10012284_54480 [Mangrovihabitans endophyticus]|uniref:Glycosyl transferase family 1 domain-containing protein n=2 Tax=Mangrovihabitans endophyticus TaxID=1751298 RepID=A0A8J3C5M9_9ACTN|nr:hypothetical protein GCM10012284_54480 [Mangrovihabitans endophyticus]
MNLYWDASVFIQTSYEEGLGLSVLEAMSCGLPVVATETDGSRETVANGETGYLVPQRHGEDRVIEGLAMSILSVFYGRGPAMGRAGRKRCEEKFSSDATFAKYRSVYEKLLCNAEEARMTERYS